MKTRFAAPLALACGIALAQAQPIYRCGDSYGSQPCAGGKEIASDAVAPDASERKQASAAAQRDARLADGLERERLKQEARAPGAYIPPPAAEPKYEPHRWPEKAATRKLDVFTASGPAPAKKDKDKSGKAGKARTGAGAGKPKKAAAPAGDKPKAPAGRLAMPANR